MDFLVSSVEKTPTTILDNPSFILLLISSSFLQHWGMLSEELRAGDDT